MSGTKRDEALVTDPDVQYCPHCGESITSQQRHFREDLVLNRYRTEFRCPACNYHGEVFRHDGGEKNPDVMTDGGTVEDDTVQSEKGALRDIEGGDYECSHCGGRATNLLGEEHIWKCSEITPNEQLHEFLREMKKKRINVIEGGHGYDDHSETYRNGVASGMDWVIGELEGAIEDE